MVVGGAALKPQCIVAQVQPKTAPPQKCKATTSSCSWPELLQKGPAGALQGRCSERVRVCAMRGNRVVAVAITTLPCRMHLHQLGEWGVCVKGQQHASVGPQHARKQRHASPAVTACVRMGLGHQPANDTDVCSAGVSTRKQQRRQATRERRRRHSARVGSTQHPHVQHTQLQVPVECQGWVRLSVCAKKSGSCAHVVAAHSLRGRGI